MSPIIFAAVQFVEKLATNEKKMVNFVSSYSFRGLNPLIAIQRNKKFSANTELKSDLSAGQYLFVAT